MQHKFESMYSEEQEATTELAVIQKHEVILAKFKYLTIKERDSRRMKIMKIVTNLDSDEVSMAVMKTIK